MTSQTILTNILKITRPSVLKKLSLPISSYKEWMNVLNWNFFSVCFELFYRLGCLKFLFQRKKRVTEYLFSVWFFFYEPYSCFQLAIFDKIFCLSFEMFCCLALTIKRPI